MTQPVYHRPDLGRPDLGRPVFDHDVERLLAVIALSNAAPLETLSVEAARQAYRESCVAMGLPSPRMASVEDRTAPDGCAIRIYRPLEGDVELPWLFYLHGGGWVLGDLQTHDPICRTLAADSGCCVFALDYPLAPEHPFPAALHSARAAIDWIRHRAASLRVFANRMVIAGDSAGAALAIGCCLLLRDAGAPLPRRQLLFYPATDLRGTSGSYARITDGVPLTAARMRYFLDLYLSDPAQAADPLASPLLAASLAGLPATTIVTAGHDPLRDEGIEFARRLEAEGVSVSHLHLGDQIHGFLTLGKAIRRAGTVLHQAGLELASF